VVVQKRSVDILLFVAVTSTDPRFDTLYLSNFMTLNALDVLKRIPGVADATILGARDYSMRIWLRPDRMAQLGITVTDVAAAIRAQSNQYAAGKIGQDPAPGRPGADLHRDRPGTADPARGIRQHRPALERPGGVLRVKDIARIELGAVNYDVYTTVDGRPTIGTAVYLQSGANALNVANSVRKTMDEIAKSFPAGVSYMIPFDTTRFVQASIKEVIQTLFMAALLVLAVVCHLPAELARHAHSLYRRPHFAHRVIRGSVRVRFLDQYAHPVRDRARHGHRRGRRHRRAGERRAAHGRQGPIAQGGRDRVHA